MDFYDSTQPAEIPEGAHACLYYDGDYAATPAQARRFVATRWITVLGNYRNCGIADFEQGNEVYSKPGALRAFVQGRKNMNVRARVYCNRANLPTVGSAPWTATSSPPITRLVCGVCSSRAGRPLPTTHRCSTASGDPVAFV